MPVWGCLELYAVPRSSSSIPEILKVSGSTYTRSPFQQHRRSSSRLAAAMSSVATQAIWVDTGFSHIILKFPSSSFTMMSGVLVSCSYRTSLDKEPAAKDAAAHWRSVMSYLRDQHQRETGAGRPSQYDRQAIPAIPRAEARALVLGASIWPENYGREALSVDATTFKLAPLMTHQRPSEVIYQTIRRAATDCRTNGSLYRSIFLN
ncbi:uncharacterized protein TRAVEDRAFT_44947 [Trametes versicolor FP-101664 SS1]|uniref:uncharacterized protein n=1 Tax=Trametes versicolor (strain FP-101664) TaxID=717944 RepID=UPI0004621B0F|nr:uncharacterized protein TRAVEDRAFT_44947 [Trametes versicolor FP-101664 SS1]EIW62117.1 hypothetical protein TRAVEDRAFT_44947 [Trametes versicolor FP-101664 SS1]